MAEVLKLVKFCKIFANWLFNNVNDGCERECMWHGCERECMWHGSGQTTYNIWLSKSYTHTLKLHTALSNNFKPVFVLKNDNSKL